MRRPKDWNRREALEMLIGDSSLFISSHAAPLLGMPYLHLSGDISRIKKQMRYMEALLEAYAADRELPPVEADVKHQHGFHTYTSLKQRGLEESAKAKKDAKRKSKNIFEKRITTQEDQ